MRRFDPRARYLTGLGAFNPRVRYLTGLGWGAGITPGPAYGEGNDEAAFVDPAPPIVVTPAAGMIPNPGQTPQGSAPNSVTNFLNQQSIKGIPNGALFIGLGALALLAHGGKRR